MAQIRTPEPLWTSLRRAVDDPRPPAALVLGIAFAAQIGWAGVSGLLSLPSSVAVAGAVVVATVTSWWLTAPAALGSAAIAFLVVDGFVLGRLGDLSWDGAPDALLLVVTILACLLATEARREIDAAHARTTVNKP